MEGRSELEEFMSGVLVRQAEAERAIVLVEAAGVSGDLAYSIGHERFHGSIGGRPAEPVTVRVTHVYRREDGEWKIVHRHGDNPPPYESPAGDA